jgi:hypothetical protein
MQNQAEDRLPLRKHVEPSALLYQAIQRSTRFCVRQMLQPTLSLFNRHNLCLKHVGFHCVRWATIPCQPRFSRFVSQPEWQVSKRTAFVQSTGRLYKSGVDEQLVMERSVHRSTESGATKDFWRTDACSLGHPRRHTNRDRPSPRSCLLYSLHPLS